MKVSLLFTTLLLAFAVACSETPTPAGPGATLDAQGDAKPQTDNQTLDVAAPDIGPDLEDMEALPDLAADIAAEDVDWSDLLDPAKDAASDVGKPPAGAVGQLYAQTKDTLYRLDLQAGQFALVGKFTFNKNAGNVTDMAADATGKLYAITDHDLFSCEVATAACKWATALPGTGTYNGLTFVPKGTIDAEETLIGIGTDGTWNKIDFSGVKAKVTKLGDYGGTWLSSGDAFSVEGIGTYATLKKGTGGNDSLAQIDPKNGKILQVIGDTGVKQLFGFAWWSGVFYGFSADGNVYTLDVGTGKASIVKGITVPTGAQWWGAGVSTRANGPK